MVLCCSSRNSNQDTHPPPSGSSAHHEEKSPKQIHNYSPVNFVLKFVLANFSKFDPVYSNVKNDRYILKDWKIEAYSIKTKKNNFDNKVLNTWKLKKKRKATTVRVQGYEF